MELDVDKNRRRRDKTRWGKEGEKERSSLRINENGRLILALMERLFLERRPQPISFHFFTDSVTLA
jgi:hypothetical protein